MWYCDADMLALSVIVTVSPPFIMLGGTVPEAVEVFV